MIREQNSPAEDTENQIHNEKGSDDDHRDEVNPLPRIAHRILNLEPPNQIREFQTKETRDLQLIQSRHRST